MKTHSIKNTPFEIQFTIGRTFTHWEAQIPQKKGEWHTVTGKFRNLPVDLPKQLADLHLIKKAMTVISSEICDTILQEFINGRLSLECDKASRQFTSLLGKFNKKLNKKK